MTRRKLPSLEAIARLADPLLDVGPFVWVIEVTRKLVRCAALNPQGR